MGNSSFLQLLYTSGHPAKSSKVIRRKTLQPKMFGGSGLYAVCMMHHAAMATTSDGQPRCKQAEHACTCDVHVATVTHREAHE